MEIREAILKAADSIEMNPELFNFSSTVLPSRDCGTPGCALGWIATYSDGACLTSCGRGWLYDRVLDINDSLFYNRMSAISFYWITSAEECAKALRAYADKYHPAKQPAKKSAIPDSVMQIFREAEAA